MAKNMGLNDRLAVLSIRFHTRKDAQTLCDVLNSMSDKAEGEDGSFSPRLYSADARLWSLCYQAVTYSF